MPQDYQLEARLAYLAHLAQEDTDAENYVRTLRDYAGGQHPAYLTDRQKEFLGLKAKNSNYLFAHNLCALVIASVVERLHVTGFDVVGGDDDAAADQVRAVDSATTDEAGKDLAAWASQWWDTNRMDARQDDLYEAAVRDGDAYIMVDWDYDQQSPRWTLKLKTDGTQGINVAADPETGKVLFASQEWQIYDPLNKRLNGRTRLNCYFEDRVEKYVADVQGEMEDPHIGAKIGYTTWRQWFDMDREGKAKVWPMPWVDAQGEPLGSPVVAFANSGGSEIGDLLSIQDMLNKSDLDLVAAADFSGFRILWAAGVAQQLNSSGEEAEITVSPGRLLRFTDPTSSLNAIEGSNLAAMIQTCQYWVQAAAGITRTPQFLFQAMGGTPPSGESLKMQEIGLIKKIERKQAVFGNAWEDVIALSARLWNMYRPGDAVEIERLQTLWRDPETRNEMEHLAVLKTKLELSVPDEVLWAEMGYDQEQIDEWKAAKKSNLGSALLDFMRGNQQRPTPSVPAQAAQPGQPAQPVQPAGSPGANI